MSKASHHLSIIDINDLWETPRQEYDYACQEYKIKPKVDVCATKKNSLCNEYITSKQNALKKDWTKSFFMNPPYSHISQFMAKAYAEHQEHNVDALILAYAKTDTKWWHAYVEDKAEVHFIPRRLQFLYNGLKPRYCTECKERKYTKLRICTTCKETMKLQSAPYPSVWIIYRSRK